MAIGNKTALINIYVIYQKIIIGKKNEIKTVFSQFVF